MSDMKTRSIREVGAVTASVVVASILGVVVVALTATTIWAYLSYNEQKTDVDGKIALARAEAKKEQADEDEKKFAEREKEPRREFVGPDDYGRLTFMYPKTWSAHVARDVSKGGAFEAYLNPISVPPISSSQPFALRVTIDERDYDRTLAGFDTKVAKGELKSSTTSANGENGTRLDGSFSNDIRGSAVFYKVRDKTLVIQTDIESSDIKAEFENIIKTVKFNT